jgi:hypothetical protein
LSGSGCIPETGDKNKKKLHGSQLDFLLQFQHVFTENAISVH